MAALLVPIVKTAFAEFLKRQRDAKPTNPCLRWEQQPTTGPPPSNSEWVFWLVYALICFSLIWLIFGPAIWTSAEDTNREGQYEWDQLLQEAVENERRLRRSSEVSIKEVEQDTENAVPESDHENEKEYEFHLANGKLLQMVEKLQIEYRDLHSYIFKLEYIREALDSEKMELKQAWDRLQFEEMKKRSGEQEEGWRMIGDLEDPQVDHDFVVVSDEDKI
ncbi:uncharacterized protein BCR38DRAFT_528309 [Pseudomassariella vexata]|uniref:Uncharacterized protein n=1 Tax=Pseudomassariella vexata TaxID=1141098 RepID=A0A1Y2DE30_9PEZI|nr:uncharacterized protein BCR38DRAFT_528309 [Pseudomassariella vexata]ORY56935.1 hypothetical protein BCR38DRAFT_528309 [Pseudomassariella vexata]